MPAPSRRTSRLLLPFESLRVPRIARSLASAALFAVCGIAYAQSDGEAAKPQPDTEPSLGSLWAPDAWDAPEPWKTDRWYFQAAYYTWHFHYDPAHKQSIMGIGEYRLDEHWLGGQWIVGLGLFTNSFGQFSQYLYGGLMWRPIPEEQPFYVKVSAGLLHGYEGEYKNKIPFNNYGTAPAIIPSVGYCWVRYCTEAVLLGGAGMLFTVGMTVP
jgi:hypothetical protein